MLLTPQEIVRNEFKTASRHYEADNFEDSIFHAVEAVELALAFRLDSKLTEKEKKELSEKYQSGIFLSRLIAVAEKYEVWDPSATDISGKLWKLNDMRNLFVHPGNHVSFLMQLTEQEKSGKILDALGDTDLFQRLYEAPDGRIDPNKSRRIRELVETGVVSKVLPHLNERIEEYRVPALSWDASQGLLKKQNEYFIDYIQQVILDNMDILLEELETFSSSKGSPKQVKKLVKKFVGKFEYLPFMSKEVLETARSLLKTLHYL